MILRVNLSRVFRCSLCSALLINSFSFRLAHSTMGIVGHNYNVRNSSCLNSAQRRVHNDSILCLFGQWFHDGVELTGHNVLVAGINSSKLWRRLKVYFSWIIWFGILLASNNPRNVRKEIVIEVLHDNMQIDFYFSSFDSTCLLFDTLDYKLEPELLARSTLYISLIHYQELWDHYYLAFALWVFVESS